MSLSETLKGSMVPGDAYVKEFERANRLKLELELTVPEISRLRRGVRQAINRMNEYDVPIPDLVADLGHDCQES